MEKADLDGADYLVARRMATPSPKFTGRVADVLAKRRMKVTEGQIVPMLDLPNNLASWPSAQALETAAEPARKEVGVRFSVAQKELGRIMLVVALKAVSDRTHAETDSLKARVECRHARVTVVGREVAVRSFRREDRAIRGWTAFETFCRKT